jgi:hypothetical protein
MATLKEYFDNDFKDLSLDVVITFTLRTQNHHSKDVEDHKIEVQQRLRQNSDSSTRLFTFYLPETPITIHACNALIDDLDKWKEQGDGLEVIGEYTGDKTIGNHSAIYSKRIYFYTESQLSDEEISSLDDKAKEKNLFITIRSQDYLNQKMKTEEPVAFISHDSKNKELIAKPIANGLNSRLCHVWYDEYSMKVGDSLRESIEKGIKEAKKCVLILTPEFLKNPGWTKKEFNSIFTREMIFEERIVLPIWHNVKKEEVYDYSPSLADTVALQWPNPAEKTKEEYDQEVQQIISKLHTAITN